MHLLDIVTILCTGLLIGSELAVSLFVNPILRRLEERAQAAATGMFARLLGRVMPFWYGACLLLLAVEAYLRRHEAAVSLLTVAAGLWLLVIVYSVVALVPINNRMMNLGKDVSPAGWQREHRRWDVLHHLRVLLLMIALACFLCGVL